MVMRLEKMLAKYLKNRFEISLIENITHLLTSPARKIY